MTLMLRNCIVLIADYIFAFLSSNEFVTTLTELNAIAPPAITGDNNHPVDGYKTPAAIGMPKQL